MLKYTKNMIVYLPWRGVWILIKNSLSAWIFLGTLPFDTTLRAPEFSRADELHIQSGKSEIKEITKDWRLGSISWRNTMKTGKEERTQ